MKRDYYPLEKAADILNCSVTDLIHLGSNRKLSVFILTAKYDVLPKYISFKGGNPAVYGVETKRMMKLGYQCLAEFEAGDHQAWVFIERTPMPEGYIHYELQHSNMMYPTIEMLMEYQKRGRNIDEITPPPVLLRDCTMVIMHDDLNRLKLSADDPGGKSFNLEERNKEIQQRANEMGWSLHKDRKSYTKSTIIKTLQESEIFKEKRGKAMSVENLKKAFNFREVKAHIKQEIKKDR